MDEGRGYVMFLKLYNELSDVRQNNSVFIT